MPSIRVTGMSQLLSWLHFLASGNAPICLMDGYGKETGDGRQFVISGCGDWEHLGCCQAVTVNQTRKQLL